MHNNSLEVNKVITKDGSKEARRNAILGIIRASKWPLSDYQILKRFKPGSDDMNLVRPRISELHVLGVLEEGPPVKSHVKNCNVRSSKVCRPEVKQQSMF